jgi:hypothetical protein
MLSRAANAKMSAQETVCGHAASIADLAASMTSKPCKLGLFAGESFSAVLFAVELIKTEPSHPYIMFDKITIDEVTNDYN